MNPALYASDQMDWQTPYWVLCKVRSLGAIALDPCSAPENPTSARVWLHPPTDGLLVDWKKEAGGGVVFVNPPYGRALAKWSEKIVYEARAGTRIVTLTPSRTDTKWWHAMLEAADTCCLLRGRISFIDPRTRLPRAPAPFPACVMGFNEDIGRGFGSDGAMITGAPPF